MMHKFLLAVMPHSHTSASHFPGLYPYGFAILTQRVSTKGQGRGWGGALLLKHERDASLYSILQNNHKPKRKPKRKKQTSFFLLFKTLAPLSLTTPSNHIILQNENEKKKKKSSHIPVHKLTGLRAEKEAQSKVSSQEERKKKSAEGR